MRFRNSVSHSLFQLWPRRVRVPGRQEGPGLSGGGRPAFVGMRIRGRCDLLAASVEADACGPQICSAWSVFQAFLAIPRAPLCDSRVSSEPGVFGVVRPVLLLPEGIEERLSPAQLDAILTHELCHIRRRDNLTAAIHMAVHAIFWFHPLIWWIGSRLIEERERACDEEVLRSGCQPGVYAGGILTVCRLYLSSPLACVSGVTGSNLARRIGWILGNRHAAELNPGKKLALGLAGAAALAVPVLLGILNAPAIRAQDATDWQTRAGGRMAFEVASVKLSTSASVSTNVPLNVGEAYRPTGGHFIANFPLWTYIQFAYKIWPAEDLGRQILVRLPKWVATDLYSIDARAAGGNPTKDQMRLMVQSLLADRFKLAAHFENTEVPVFALTLEKAGKLGPKLIAHSDGRPCGDSEAASGTPVPARVIRGEAAGGPENFPPQCDAFALIRKSGGALMLAGYRNATMEMMAASLSGLVGRGRPVVDRTGLSGRFDFTMEWAPDTPPSDPAAPPSDPLGATALQALRDQLGLKLEATRARVPVLFIDRVERPSEN